MKRKKIIIVAMLFFFLAPWLRSVSSAHLCGGHVCFLSEKECTEEGHHHKEGHHHESTHGPGEGLRGHGKDGNTCFLKSGCGEDPQKSSPEETPFVVEAFFLRREEPLRENLSVEASFYREPPSFPPERPPAAA